MGKLHASRSLGLKNLVLTGLFSCLIQGQATTTIVDEDFSSGNAGYTVNNTGSIVNDWQFDSGANEWIVVGACCIGASSSSALSSPTMTLETSGEVSLLVSHRYNFEFDGTTRFDGGQIRISVNGGFYQTVSSFSQNGYDGIIEGANALNGLDGFSGVSSGYDTGTFHDSVASLGSFQSGDTLSIQFLGAWNEWNRAGYPSWAIDQVQLTQSSTPPPSVVIASSSTDAFMASATSLTGNGGSGSRMNYFSMRTRKAPVHGGTVTARISGTITDANAAWADDAFNGSNGRHYVEFENGVTADIEGTQASSQSLSVPGSLPNSVVAGMSYLIRPHTTLGDIFGYNNEWGLTPGPNPSVADNVILYMADSQVTMTFFYSSVTGYEGWYRNTYEPAQDTVIYIEQGIMVRRRTDGDVSLFHTGQVRGSSVNVPVYAGFNFLGILQANNPITLDNLNIFTGNATTGLAGGSNLTEADNLMLINPDSTTSTYFYSDFPGYEGWYDATYTSADNVSIAAGSAFFLQRKSPRGLFQWSLPQE